MRGIAKADEALDDRALAEYDPPPLDFKFPGAVD